jgi:hypothetical protein
MLTGFGALARGAMRTRLISTLAAMKMTVQLAYTAVGPNPYSNPPSDGPQMTAVC